MTLLAPWYLLITQRGLELLTLSIRGRGGSAYTLPVGNTAVHNWGWGRPESRAPPAGGRLRNVEL